MDAAITLDTDWAPDAAIAQCAKILVDANVRATWFVTHESPAIAALREHPALFEIGIHPNFLRGSSHGATEEDVLATCMRMVPDAVSMRTHALVQSTPLFDVVLRHTPIRCDASLLLPYASHVEPLELQWKGKSILRVPYVWEDDIEMMRDEPSWSVTRALGGGGLRVFDFHPIHVALNSCDFSRYEELKAAVKPVSRATAEDVARFENPTAGSRTAFVALVAELARGGGGLRMRDIYERWRKPS
ncbi:MAG TPA: hypothetical protein VIF62_24325 [Labilithrix sp.]|jgi:hypothetical protein